MNKLNSLALQAGLLVATAIPLAHGQDTSAITTITPAAEETKAIVATGSTAFCLFELPATTDGKRRWVNLGIVQYLESNRNELKIFYGGGNLGAGHEARIAIANPAQLEETLNFIRQTAANCR